MEELIGVLNVIVELIGASNDDGQGMAVVIGVFNVNEVSENLFGAFSDEYDVNEVIGVLNEEFDNDEVIAVLDDEWGIDDLISLLSDVEYDIADITGPLTLD